LQIKNHFYENMLSIIILAAGKGTRMGGDIPKVLRKVGGLTMLEHVVKTAKKLTENVIVVVSKENHDEIQKLKLGVEYSMQSKLDGTASAVLSAEEKYLGGDILVLLGDVPLLKSETLEKIVRRESKCAVLGFQNGDENNKFGRVILNGNVVEKIVEYSEATAAERQIKTVNSGILFLGKEYLHLLERIENKNSKSEYYLTDIVKICVSENVQVDYFEADALSCLGANTPEDLAVLEDIILKECTIKGNRR
jgi:bifunctional UDP-N-acetylglucosamine pyrophosphorylase/glucosamine-1-phosphate N-acetyltransferase